MTRSTRIPVSITGPDPIDVHVGNRIRLRRAITRVSQEKLSATIGVTFQQVQKYESGHNRVSASRLHKIATVLGVPVAYFFEGLDGPTEIEADAMKTNWALDVIGRLGKMDSGKRNSVIDLVRSMTTRPVAEAAE